MGGDRVWMTCFLTSANRVTRGIPVHQIETMDRVISVLDFVELMRTKP